MQDKGNALELDTESYYTYTNCSNQWRIWLQSKSVCTLDS